MGWALGTGSFTLIRIVLKIFLIFYPKFKNPSVGLCVWQLQYTVPTYTVSNNDD